MCVGDSPLLALCDIDDEIEEASLFYDVLAALSKAGDVSCRTSDEEVSAYYWVFEWWWWRYEAKWRWVLVNSGSGKHNNRERCMT